MAESNDSRRAPNDGEPRAADPGLLLDMKDTMSYGDYLHLDEVLSAQVPLSPAHDEMLFIVQHQTSELWMKLMLHEVRSACRCIAREEMGPAFKMLARVSRVMEQLISAWDVLSTMTPHDYSQLRPHLGSSSGFQSWQYRAIEFSLGNKNAAMRRPHEHVPSRLRAVDEAWRAPSLYDESLRLLARRGFAIPPSLVERDWTEPYQRSEEVLQAWLAVYRDTERYWDLYQLAEDLADVEDAFRQWRFRHLTTVERVIGFKQGTGGSVGVPYLRRMLDVTLFPEVWGVRTIL
ncbi:MAG: tryptophan 2,3-dioxygenase [Vicinamibacterales bacterium]